MPDEDQKGGEKEDAFHFIAYVPVGLLQGAHKAGILQGTCAAVLPTMTLLRHASLNTGALRVVARLHAWAGHGVRCERSGNALYCLGAGGRYALGAGRAEGWAHCLGHVHPGEIHLLSGDTAPCDAVL